MNPKLDSLLCQKYPKIFANRHSPITQSCMGWGFEVDDGWFHLLDTLCSAIQSHIDHTNTRREEAIKDNAAIDEGRISDLPFWKRTNPPVRVAVPEEVSQVVADQVKEKYGGLRFYYTGGDDTIRNYIDFAEQMSYKVCEHCGAPGILYTDGWHKVYCDTHAKKENRTNEYITPFL